MPIEKKIALDYLLLVQGERLALLFASRSFQGGEI